MIWPLRADRNAYFPDMAWGIVRNHRVTPRVAIAPIACPPDRPNRLDFIGARGCCEMMWRRRGRKSSPIFCCCEGPVLFGDARWQRRPLPWLSPAATSSARLALSWPLISARSTAGPSTSRIFGCGRDSTCVPLKWLASWMSEDAAMISISGLAHAASGPHAAGHIKPSQRALAPMAAGNTPATGAMEPSRPSSPSTVKVSNLFGASPTFPLFTIIRFYDPGGIGVPTGRAPRRPSCDRSWRTPS